MKTDLAKTLSIRGQHGLFNYIAQSRTGAIVEALYDKKRANFAVFQKSNIMRLTEKGVPITRNAFNIVYLYSIVNRFLITSAPLSSEDPKS